MSSNLKPSDTCASLTREFLGMDRVRWIFRNDQPAEGAVSHAYYSGKDISVCKNHDRSGFDWTELEGDRCELCRHVLSVDQR